MRRNAIKNLFKPLPPHKRSILMGLDQNAYYGTDFTYGNTNLNSFVNTYNPTLCFALINLTDKSSQTNLNDNTKIIRVRRLSDSIEADIYGDAAKRLSNSSPAVYIQNSQTQTTTFQNFFSGTQCAVVKWYNQANNADGTRNTNDLFASVSANQPHISQPGAPGTIAFTSFANVPQIYSAFALEAGNPPDLGTLQLTTPINTKNNTYEDFSFILVKSGTIGVNNDILASNYIGGPTNNADRFLSMNGNLVNFKKEIYNGETIVDYVAQNTGATSFTACLDGKVDTGATVPSQRGNVRAAIVEMHEETIEGNLTKKRAYFYGNNVSSFENVGGKGILSPTNATGFRALPGGVISAAGVRTEVGQSAYFPAESDLFQVAGNTYMLTLKDVNVTKHIGETGEFLPKAAGVNIRLMTTTAPSGNPTIGGVTYNYISLITSGGVYYITTTNFTGSTYPNGTTIPLVTTDAAWTSTAPTGARRTYEAIFGTYYSGIVGETINSQGGYSAAGASWKVFNQTNIITLGVSFSGEYYVGSGLNKTNRNFMYQLSDAEYTSAGNIGRWDRAASFKFGYRIFGLWLWGYSLTNNSRRAGSSAFIYFDRSINYIRDEVHADLNRLLKIYS